MRGGNGGDGGGGDGSSSSGGFFFFLAALLGWGGKAPRSIRRTYGGIMSHARASALASC